MIKEKITKAGKLLNTDFYPCFDNGRKRPTQPKAKGTTEAQKKYNDNKALKELIYIINENFDSTDNILTLTFKPENAPQDEEELRRLVNNYFRRLKRLRKKELHRVTKLLEALPDDEIFDSQRKELEIKKAKLEEPFKSVYTKEQVEVNNQYGYMFKDMPQDLKNKSIGKLVKGYGTMFLGAYAYNALYSALTGRDAAFDPLSIIDDLLKDLFGDDEEEPADIIMNFTDNVLEEVPFVGGLIGGGRIPISSALPYDDGIYGAFEGIVTDVTEGNWGNLAKEVGESFVSYLLLPAGGGQIKKSIQGLQMFDDDFPIAGSYTDSGKLRFSVEETPGNIAQATLFGQYASKTARQYFDEEHAPLSDKQTKELVDIQASMEEYWEYQKGLKKLGEDATLAEKIDYIADLEEFDTWQKNIMANNLTDRKTPIDLTGYEAIGDFEEFDYSMKNPEKYAISKAVGGYDNYIKYSEHLGNITAEKDKNGNSVSGSRKKKVARYINNLDIEFGEKMILYRSQYKSDDTYNAQIVEYLNDRNDITHQDKITILTELGFKVLSDGTVKW